MYIIMLIKKTQSLKNDSLSIRAKPSALRLTGKFIFLGVIEKNLKFSLTGKLKVKNFVLLFVASIPILAF